MTDQSDDDFRVRPSAPKNRGKGQGQSFVSKVLKQSGKASNGKSAVRRPASARGTGQRPGGAIRSGLPGPVGTAPSPAGTGTRPRGTTTS